MEKNRSRLNLRHYHGNVKKKVFESVTVVQDALRTAVFL
jgi:hypothetical protein